MMEIDKNSREMELPLTPTLYVCLGVSGAGLTTAVNYVHELGLAELAPSQFVTRRLRSNEKRGDQYYPVTKDVLTKVPNHIALQSEFYGNTYGFFYPAIRKIQQALRTKNVIVDSGNSPSDWRAILNNQFPIVSLFFAPENPFISIDRIIKRAQQAGDMISGEDLLRRSQSNAETIHLIRQYDYWVDTTDFADVVPVLESVMKVHSFGSASRHPKVKSVQESQDDIEKLLEKYKADPTEYIYSQIQQ